MLKGLLEFELFVLSCTSIFSVNGLRLSDELLRVQRMSRLGYVGMMIDDLLNRNL